MTTKTQLNIRGKIAEIKAQIQYVTPNEYVNHIKSTYPAKR